MKPVYRIIIYCLSVLTLSAQAQEKSKVTLVNDTAYLDGVAQFVVRSKSSPAQLMASFNSMDGKPQATLRMRNSNDTTIFSARFPTINLSYDCRYPKIELLTMVESYINNKIIVKGQASKEGLQAYCKDRGLPIKEIPVRNVAKPGQDASRDSVLLARAKEREAKMFTFSVSNKSKSSVNIFLGDTTASRTPSKPDAVPFRQGRYETIKTGETKEVKGFEGEFVCISDSLHKIYDLRLLKKTIKTVAVKKNGTSFE